jgi:CubicO group peptidase (beta-lactamase class C family)
MGYEYWSRGNVHRATIWASVFVVGLQQLRDPIGYSAPFQAFAAWVQIHARSFHIQGKIMSKSLRSWWVATIFVACVVSLRAQTTPPADLDSYATNSMKTFDVPGMAIAIVKEGTVVVAKGYGVRKLGDPTPVDEHTMFGVASITKAFTTAALATLVDAGKLSWDDPVYQRLPGFVMYDPYVSHEVTIRDLLTHFSGLGGNQGYLLFWPPSTFTREEIIYKLRFMKPASRFRNRFGGGKVLLYLVAGQIIPSVTGITWDNYIRQYVFAPLGMNNTNVNNAEFKPGDNYSFPHGRLDGKLQVIHFEKLDGLGPAGSINSCAADMAKWVQLQLNRGKFVDRDGRLFSEQQSEEMWSPQMILAVHDPPLPLAGLKRNFADEGLGWWLKD